MQALHPLAMAGVDQHSGWRHDPVGRLAATSAYLATVSFGERAAAERAAARVRRIHEHVRGTDPVTGQPYAAERPGAAAVGARGPGRVGHRRRRELFGTPLSPQDSDRYVAEMAVAAELVGVPAELVPASAAEPATPTSPRSGRELRCTPAASESMAYLLDPPGLDPDIAEIWQDIRYGAVAALPDWAREMYGYRAPPLTPAPADEIRQALGVLDAVFLGEPGVLEARQRIALRMRAAQRP